MHLYRSMPQALTWWNQFEGEGAMAAYSLEPRPLPFPQRWIIFRVLVMQYTQHCGKGRGLGSRLGSLVQLSMCKLELIEHIPRVPWQYSNIPRIYFLSDDPYHLSQEGSDGRLKPRPSLFRSPWCWDLPIFMLIFMLTDDRQQFLYYTLGLGSVYCHKSLAPCYS